MVHPVGGGLVIVLESATCLNWRTLPFKVGLMKYRKVGMANFLAPAWAPLAAVAAAAYQAR
jgi:hypothetical protein